MIAEAKEIEFHSQEIQALWRIVNTLENRRKTLLHTKRKGGSHD